MSRNTIRGEDYGRTKGKDVSVDKMVAKILSGEIRGDNEVLGQLRRKYHDEQIILKIFDVYKKSQHFIMKKAKKFKQLLIDRYKYTLPAHEIIRKARKYKKKYELTDAEFSMFVKLIRSDT